MVSGCGVGSGVCVTDVVVGGGTDGASRVAVSVSAKGGWCLW